MERPSNQRKPELTGDNMPDDLLTTKEALSYLKVTRPTLLKFARMHGIRRVQLGTANRWPRKELERLVKARTKTVR